MSTFYVLHNLLFAGFHFQAISPDHTPKVHKNSLRLVAKVRCESIDDAYRLTNHIDRSWELNPEVEVVSGSRSTSVGDVIIEEGGEAWVVMPLGFQPLAEMEGSAAREEDLLSMFTSEVQNA